MIWSVALALGMVIAAGTYLAFSRDLLRCLIGLALLGNGINLLLFSSGRLTVNAPPVIDSAELTLKAAANPLPQALVLTAIGISFGMTAVIMIMAIGGYLSAGHDRIDLDASDDAGADK